MQRERERERQRERQREREREEREGIVLHNLFISEIIVNHFCHMHY